MSSSRGNDTRKRPQKHQNRTAFKNNLHDTSHTTKFINSIEVTGVCKRCKDIIEWKIKYKKYKPLTAPRKCVNCNQKAVKYAYHMLCSKCAKDKKVCAKCFVAGDSVEAAESVLEGEDVDVKTLLKTLPERKRRTILRIMSKQQDGDQKLTQEKMTQIQEMVSKMDNVSLGDDFLSDDDFDSSGSDPDDT